MLKKIAKKKKKEHVCNTGDPLVFPHPVIKDNEELQKPNSDRIANGPDPSGTKVWVTPPCK